MLICIALLAVQVSGIETIFANTQDVVTMIAHEDGGQAAVALATLWNNEELLLETVPKLLPLLKTCPPTFNENWLEQEAKPFPEWRTSLVGKFPDRWKGKERKEIVLKWICSAIREAKISPRRDIVRKTVLEYLEGEGPLGSERYYCARDLYFWWGSEIEPESDCSELLAFIDRELAKHQDISETNGLSMPLGEYIRYKVDRKDWNKWVLKYKDSFSQKAMGFLKMLLYERWSEIHEVEFKSLDKLEPEELVKMLDNPSQTWTLKDQLIKHVLAGTKELRIKNFDLLLPILKQTSGISKAGNFLSLYITSIPKDASDIEKHQQDVLLDIIEQKIETDRPFVVLKLLKGMVSTDFGFVSYAYAKDRVITILKRCSNDNRFVNEFGKNEAEILLRQVEDIWEYQ